MWYLIAEDLRTRLCIFRAEYRRYPYDKRKTQHFFHPADLGAFEETNADGCIVILKNLHRIPADGKTWMDKAVSAIRGKEHNMKSNIVLIGMPGVGKSTIGVVLAKNLGYHFMDSDIVIQQQTGKLLHEIITEKGLDGFLQTEDEVNAGIDAEKTVIATGGSAVFGKHAMQHLAENGTIIYLSLPYEQIEERLGDLHKRGVALRENQTLYDIYQERIPLYEKYADLIIDCQQKSIRQIVAEIARKLGNKE